MDATNVSLGKKTMNGKFFMIIMVDGWMDGLMLASCSGKALRKRSWGLVAVMVGKGKE